MDENQADDRQVIEVQNAEIQVLLDQNRMMVRQLAVERVTNEGLRKRIRDLSVAEPAPSSLADPPPEEK